jgi:small subunit ribosomal protein S4
MVRSGFAPTHSAGRQMVSHGHMKVNGVIVTIPSYQVKVGDTITIREGSKNKVIFSKLDEELANTKTPSWISVDQKTRTIKIAGKPCSETTDLLFDVQAVFEFYTR